ncbi:MAG: DNA replication/repair protein RecF [Anaplasma sp.]
MVCSPHSCVQSIKLRNFRNYTKAELESGDQSVVLFGRNGAGKTNVLEAISMLSKGSGLRNASPDCMQNCSSETPWGVHHTILSGGTQSSVSIIKHEQKRRLQIDKKAGLYCTLHNILCIVWLIPQLDHTLLKTPSERLRFFDRVVHIFDKDYSTHMVRYERAKRDRRKVLQEAPQNHNWLSSLEHIMATSGLHIAQTRCAVLKILQNTAANNEVCSPFLEFAINLESKVFALLEDQENAVDLYLWHLKEGRAKDMSRPLTSFGIHNDHFQMFNTNKNLAANSCSTGEQKILLLSLLLTAATAKRRIHNQAPIMLLDDIMSHLDSVHKTELTHTIRNIGCQAWITDVDGNNFEDAGQHFRRFHVAENRIDAI